MSRMIEKKPQIIYNNIPDQIKTAANSLTIQEWNNVINILKTQANLNSEYVEKLHRFFFGDWDSNTTGHVEFDDMYNSGLFDSLLEIVENVKKLSTVHIGPEQPSYSNVVLWIDTEE